ncbi:MAG TPA: outer membrane beta-barrel protein [Vicinamibacterales bacterium]|nr:outer membrane beta-barrel protein [Vicinamibacterales bacterium]
MRIVPIVLAGALVIALASPVSAQGTSTSGMFVGGLGGLTFGTATSSAIGGQVGVRIMPNVFVIGEFGRIQDVLPAEISDQIQEGVDFLEQQGIPVDIDVKVPALYGFGGLRWAQSGRRIAPFVEGGAGFAHLTSKISGTVAGVDITEFIEDQIGDLDQSINEFLIAFGGGVNIGLTPTVSADAGYRFTRIFTEDPVVNTSMIYGAIKIMFGR